MSLDAIVYIHKDNLKMNVDADILQVDEETGEVFIEDCNLTSNYPSNVFAAVQYRLGNLSSIACLYEEIAKVFSDEPSLLLEKVVYSGSHSGDKIDLVELDKLEAEIDLLKQQLHGSSTVLLEQFIQNMTELIQVARREGNPTVFV